MTNIVYSTKLTQHPKIVCIVGFSSGMPNSVLIPV